MAAPRWIVDTSAMPVVVLRLPAGAKETSDLSALFSDFGAVLERRERFVLIIDLSQTNPDAARRKRIIEWIQAHIDAVRRYVVANALVAPTAFHRGIIVAATWFVKSDIPVEVFGDFGSAIQWANERVRLYGLSPRPHGA